MSSQSRHAVAIARSARRLRALMGVILLLLAAQFLVGMVVNLYVQLPPTHPGTQASEYFSGVARGVTWAIVAGPAWLVVHVIIGLALVVASIVALALAIAARRWAWIVASLVGWIGVAAAGFNGASYMNYGHEFSSLLMSVGFVVAAAAYVIGLYTMRAEVA
jgi:hypothetical protein